MQLKPSDGRFLYSIEPSASGSTRSATSIDVKTLEDAAIATAHFINNSGLQTVTHLLARSLQTPDNLQAFLTAWAGFEIFLDQSFKALKPKIYSQMKAALRPAARSFVERLQDVIEKSARYNVRDKFIVVSSILNLADPEADLKQFLFLKKMRDDIHLMTFPPHGYPTLQTQNLLRKYLQLHIFHA